MSKATAGKKPKTYGSDWETMADTPEQAANPRTRAELKQIAAIVKESGVSRFSLDALVNIATATAIGRRVHFELEAA